MQGAQPLLDLVPSMAVCHKRIDGQCAERGDERPAVDRCLASAELVGRPLNDGHKVMLGWLGQPNAPASPSLRHFLAPGPPRSDNPIRYFAQVALQSSWLSKVRIRTGLDRGDPSHHRGA